MTVIIIVSVVTIALIEGISLIKKNEWKELITAGIIVSIAVLLQIGKAYGIITPINLIEKYIEPIGKLYLKKL